MEKYKYTQTWFLQVEIKDELLNFISDKDEHNILEIGCFEGLSSVFFSDNLLNYPSSSMICVDPFLTINNNDHNEFLRGEAEANFDYNISQSKNFTKITVYKTTSDDFFLTNDQTFDFIYVDGCHLPDFVSRDMENSFKCLKVNEIMWMDDYCKTTECKEAMDNFLKLHINQYTIIHKGYQLAIKKLSPIDNESCYEIYVLSYNNCEREERMIKRFNEIKITPNICSFKENDNRVRILIENGVDKSHAGGLGCFFNFLKLMEDFYANSSKEFGIFLENDVFIKKQLGFDLPNVCYNLKKLNLDVLLIGYLLDDTPDAWGLTLLHIDEF